MLTRLKKKPYWLTLGLLCFLIGGLSLLFWGQKQEAPQPTERRWRVQSLRLQRGDYTPEVILYGHIYSPQRSTLASTLKAKVVDLPVREGEQVAKDQVLLALNEEEFHLLVLQRQAQLAKLGAELKSEYAQYDSDKKTHAHWQELLKTQQSIVDRLRRLEARQHESAAQVDEALKVLYQQQINVRSQELALASHPHRIEQLKAERAHQEALLRQARIDLAETRIRAPFAGRIIEVLVALGDDVSEHQKLLSLYNLDDVELRARLPFTSLQMLAHLPDHQSISAIPVDYPDYRLPLLRSGAALTRGDASIDVFFKLPELLARRLPLGFTLTVRLLLPPEKNLFRIPAAALYGGKRIYQIINHRLQGVAVQRVGEQFADDGHYYLVRSQDLPEEVLILSSQLTNARDGLPVQST